MATGGNYGGGENTAAAGRDPPSMEALGLRHSRSLYDFAGARRSQQLSQTVRALGYSDSEVDTAIERLQEANEDVTLDSLIDTAHVVQNELIETGSAPASLDIYNQTKPNVPIGGKHASDFHERVAIDTTPTNEELRTQLLRSAIEKKKMELRSKIDKLTYWCRVCNCSKATILLLPCGHLASCDDCLMDVRRCPISRCNKVVRGTKEVYFG